MRAKQAAGKTDLSGAWWMGGSEMRLTRLTADAKKAGAGEKK
jgi:hypothetical protein